MQNFSSPAYSSYTGTRERKRERERETERERERERHTHRQTDRQRDRHTETEREEQRQTDRQLIFNAHSTMPLTIDQRGGERVRLGHIEIS